MTLIAVTSAKGAPGVTTLTVALAALAGEGAVVADLDPDGGDLALRYRRDDGRPLDPSVGLLSLAASIRRGGRSAGPGGQTGQTGQTGPGGLADHVQRASGGLAVLAGVSRPEQVAGLGPLWRHVARALHSGGTVFADCGRSGPMSAVLPVITAADAVVVVARAELEELAHLRERLRFLAGVMPSSSAANSRIGVVLITGERDQAASIRVERLLASAGLNIPVIGRIADDPKGAAVLRGIRSGRPGRTLLIRSARSLLPAVLALAQRSAVDDAGLLMQPAPNRVAAPAPIARPPEPAVITGPLEAAGVAGPLAAGPLAAGPLAAGPSEAEPSQAAPTPPAGLTIPGLPLAKSRYISPSAYPPPAVYPQPADPRTGDR